MWQRRRLFSHFVLLQLHNNTSPDDVIICEALLAYIDADLDMAAYWSTLQVASPSKCPLPRGGLLRSLHIIHNSTPAFLTGSNTLQHYHGGNCSLLACKQGDKNPIVDARMWKRVG